MDFDLDPEAYAYLRQLAGRIHAERGGTPSIQPTALLHEAWARLVQGSSRYESRAHFMATAARAMRFIMVDRARARGALKRADPRMKTTLAGVSGGPALAIEVLELEDLLERLAQIDPLCAEIVTLRVFGGLSVAEVAQSTGNSERTIYSRWRFARGWLAEKINDTD